MPPAPIFCTHIYGLSRKVSRGFSKARSLLMLRRIILFWLPQSAVLRVPSRSYWERDNRVHPFELVVNAALLVATR